MRVSIFAACLFAALLIVAPSATAAPQAQAAGSLRPAAGRDDGLSAITDHDAHLYAQIFALQEQGHFASAERLEGDVHDRVLMGYVLMQRYLALGATPSWSDLAAWLEAYGDLPGADDVYGRAVALNPAQSGDLKRPETRGGRSTLVTDTRPRLSPRLPSARGQIVIAKISAAIKDGDPDGALALLAKSAQSFDRLGLDDQTQAIAASYFAEGEDAKAYALAHDVAARNRREVPQADWIAGLAAWRMRDIAKAEPHFAALARSDTAVPASRAAGAFWAARANLRLQHPERVGAFLELASATPRSFYGVLALRQLGRDLPFNWKLPELDNAAWSSFAPYPALARAVALTQIGRRDLAETELLRLHGTLPQSLDLILLSVATRLHLTAVEAELQSDSTFEGLDGGRYPVPNITPRGGFTIDPALIYAFMHKESGFDARAQSKAGARGLMQIMPATAKGVVGDEMSARELKQKLLDPAYNLHVAQRYLRDLMRRVEPEGNLYMLAVAYNGGPGNLARWREKLGETDPLLFIESVPSAETRTYIECVLTNYWAYRSRLGKDLASLDAAAAGDWPLYDLSENAIVVGER